MSRLAHHRRHGLWRCSRPDQWLGSGGRSGEFEDQHRTAESQPDLIAIGQGSALLEALPLQKGAIGALPVAYHPALMAAGVANHGVMGREPGLLGHAEAVVALTPDGEGPGRIQPGHLARLIPQPQLGW